MAGRVEHDPHRQALHHVDELVEGDEGREPIRKVGEERQRLALRDRLAETALDGDAISETDARGERVSDESFLLVFNAHYEALDFCMPDAGERWVRVLDTADAFNEGDTPAAGETAVVDGRSIAVFRRAA